MTDHPTPAALREMISGDLWVAIRNTPAYSSEDECAVLQDEDDCQLVLDAIKELLPNAVLPSHLAELAKLKAELTAANATTERYGDFLDRIGRIVGKVEWRDTGHICEAKRACQSIHDMTKDRANRIHSDRMTELLGPPSPPSAGGAT